MEIELKNGSITLLAGEVEFSQGGSSTTFENSDELALALTHLLKLMAVDSCLHGMVCEPCQEVVC